MESITFVILGATGDLSRKKIVPEINLCLFVRMKLNIRGK